MRVAAALMSFALPCLAATAQAAGWQDLYQSSAIVTGTVATTRADGLAQCLRDVLVKVSGNPALLDDPRVDALGGTAAELVEDFAYLDRQSDMPRHDEQGSRDRPFTLIAHFAPTKIDAALAALGEQPWRADRPPLLVRITVRDRNATFPMTADADADERQRQALLASAERYGMRVVLLPKDRLAVGAAPPGSVPLDGTLTWSDAAFGWVGEWRLAWQGRDIAWGITGVSFDEAFRNAVRGAMGVLSGHAEAVSQH
ncbi:DUF2066 domain-containing protein [Limobrevibacterium gyesilva]|uniref:DUF2066 domain-containing protein n=1 Tax=Limobrevibacterium gyesilva TaxID=2991712 RepID=A0AA41YMY3_9PROT|nr:DUF2066 domain-containing protein [Limobrevibacterium gyesilva]MCW3474988.1 DUF2066 domain-containing protein [Limobrevibacterium gyesilva]